MKLQQICFLVMTRGGFESFVSRNVWENFLLTAAEAYGWVWLLCISQLPLQLSAVIYRRFSHHRQQETSKNFTFKPRLQETLKTTQIIPTHRPFTTGFSSSPILTSRLTFQSSARIEFNLLPNS